MEYQRLRDSVKAKCPLTDDEISYNQCWECQKDQLPFGCWEADDFHTYLECLIDVEMYGEEKIGDVRKMQLKRLCEKYGVKKDETD